MNDHFWSSFMTTVPFKFWSSFSVNERIISLKIVNLISLQYSTNVKLANGSNQKPVFRPPSKRSYMRLSKMHLNNLKRTNKVNRIRRSGNPLRLIVGHKSCVDFFNQLLMVCARFVLLCHSCTFIAEPKLLWNQLLKSLNHHWIWKQVLRFLLCLLYKSRCWILFHEINEFLNTVYLCPNLRW